MKKPKLLVAAVFTLSYAVLVSLGMLCALHVLGDMMSRHIDAGSVVLEYPRFIPFCVIMGILALIAVVILSLFNRKVSARFRFSKTTWFVQFVIAFVISIPLMYPWDMLFDYLQKIF